jgi:hypothetical protein
MANSQQPPKMPVADTFTWLTAERPWSKPRHLSGGVFPHRPNRPSLTLTPSSSSVDGDGGWADGCSWATSLTDFSCQPGRALACSCPELAMHCRCIRYADRVSSLTEEQCYGGNIAGSVDRGSAVYDTACVDAWRCNGGSQPAIATCRSICPGAGLLPPVLPWNAVSTSGRHGRGRRVQGNSARADCPAECETD